MLFSWQSPPLKPLQTTPYLVSRNHHIVKAIRSGPFHEFPSPPRRGSLSVGILMKFLRFIQSLNGAARRGLYPCFTWNL